MGALLVRGAGVTSTVFTDYWLHKQTKEQAARLSRPLLRSFQAESFDEVERKYWDETRRCRRLLDVGAGDNRVKRKFIAAGYSGVYETVDVSPETRHDYASVDEVTGAYDGILLLDVIEHMPLPAFYELLARVEQLLEPGGVLLISTPNPACIRSMWAGDMTHVQQYPLNDLLAIFLMRRYECDAYRVLYTKARLSLFERFRLWLQKVVITQLLGMDYADGLVVVATKPAR
jgi:SAM-dependent methyltransferase